MHLDVGEELLAGILQAGPEEVDHIVDDEETVVVALGGIYINRWILLVVALHVKLLLTGELAGVDGGGNIGIALAEQGEGGLVDVVVDEDDGLPGLLDEVGYLHVGVEDLPVVEDALHRRQGGTDEEINFSVRSAT